MIKLGNNLVLDKLDNVDREYTLKAEQEFYEDGSLYEIKIYYDIIKDWDNDVTLKRFIHVMTEHGIINYYLSAIYYDIDDEVCQVIYVDDGAGTFHGKIKDLYNVYMMSYSHEDATDGLTPEEIELIKKQLEDEE